MTKNWETTEGSVINKLQMLLPHGFTATQTGGNNSTLPDGLILKDGKNFKRVEIKQLPSVAGVQTVVRKDPASNIYSSLQQQSYTKLMLDLVELYQNKLNQQIELPEAHAKIAYEAFEEKYRSNGVGLLIGISDNETIACVPTKKFLAERFNPSFIVRHKKSGSSALPKSLYPFIKTYLPATSTYFEGHKIFIKDLTSIPRINSILNKVNENIWINDSGEIRKLGSTNNLTAMLSLSLKDNLNSSFKLSDSQLVAAIMEETPAF